MMSMARVLVAKMHNALKRYEVELDGVRDQRHMVIRLADIPAHERGTEKIRATIEQGYGGDGMDPHAPFLTIECEREFARMPGDRSRIRLTEAEAIDLGRFIRKNFGE